MKEHDNVAEAVTAHDSLAALLGGEANASLRYHRSEALAAYLARRIEEAVTEEQCPATATDVVRTLIADVDYRLVARFLRALRAGDAAVVDTFERIAASEDAVERKRLLYEVARADFSPAASAGGVADDVVFVTRLEALFSRSEPGLFIYLDDPEWRSPLRALLNDVGARLGDFIERQLDLPGLNTVVRHGVVKKWFSADGTEVVSKRENPHKPGCFRIEQSNYEAVLSRMGGQSKGQVLLDETDGGGSVWLRVVRPFAVIRDGYSGRRYALSVWDDGTPLEDLLLDKDDADMRPVHLAHYRRLLDALYDRGIMWGDMSPRNIIVRREGRDIVYHILDFEKTRVLDGPATTAERIAHCREYNCVEELGNVCTPREVGECFRVYCEWESWGLESEEALSFAPRPKVADLLAGRGLQHATLGTYNRVDLEVMSVRAPTNDSATGRRSFPAHLNHKIENYLRGTDYKDFADHDRKTTEILIAAKRHGCFDAAAQVLTQATGRVENALLKAEFDGLLQEPAAYFVMPPRRVTDALVQTIDMLYQSRERAEDFTRLCARLNSDRSTGLE
jgi:hypothetical protein